MMILLVLSFYNFILVGSWVESYTVHGYGLISRWHTNESFRVDQEGEGFLVS